MPVALRRFIQQLRLISLMVEVRLDLSRLILSGLVFLMSMSLALVSTTKAIYEICLESTRLPNSINEF